MSLIFPFNDRNVAGKWSHNPVELCFSLRDSIYGNCSSRSYDLMERLLKIYVYKEGEKPIFHNPRLRGLYAAEGWFMKLLQGSKRFTVRDPRKAHLYYMAFSSDTLRATLYDEKSRNVKNLERYLADYVDLIKARYQFWNKTGGSDHFFIACHDWVCLSVSLMYLV